MPPIYVILTEGYSDWEIAVQCGVGPSFYEADIGFLLTSGSALTSAGGLQIVDPVPLSPTAESMLVLCRRDEFYDICSR